MSETRALFLGITSPMTSVERSVWLKGVVSLRSVHVMVGTGIPVELQEIFTLSSSLNVTTSPLPLAVVTGPTV